MAEQTENQFNNTSGISDPVWVHEVPYSSYPHAAFGPLKQSITNTDVCIIGAGIAGISLAYELIARGRKQVTMIEARHVLSGETGRTSGHLSNALDDGYINIEKKHGREGANIAAESHTWAVHRVGEISKELGIDCEFRHLKEVANIEKEAELAQELLGKDQVSFQEGLEVRGWDVSGPDQRDGAIFRNQATFHPTKYLLGVLNWLKDQHKFQCFEHTRMMSIEEDSKHGVVKVKTMDGHTITATDVVEATAVPLQKLSVIAEMSFNRTYCIAIRVPKGAIEDCLIYDEAEAYKYIRFTACDDKDDYLVIGGCDHKVGQEHDSQARYKELEEWVRARFPFVGSVDYKWSGQIFEPVDYMAFIGKNQGRKHTYIITGDSGNGLTHGVLAGRLIADEISGINNSWASLYSPSRVVSIAKSLPTMVEHDVQINTQYKRYLQSDITDIEDLAPNTGGVMHTGHIGQQPVAVYKDEKGKAHQLSAVCPHMKGVVCWNATEKSWDCPVHGSRFGWDGVCIEGPAKKGLTPIST
ncbi:conserved hypothetical protein [Talaromyces stipitatus ATCC 10500]|uniref:Rieske domain-containing protein n=1 Tax=Talaromyces stipitatus (strain ATCC 10500 / CBS 375.48 / QM 6759 / NRRL 1006) TaxID=441959 RepID=B8LYX9_TALSN|nr:uncharacterized protein TSTA_069080 [Talaromyces stipitatus ATCC 10500]EED23487.1 conserved hypothetical protein [Talaromyces stipitatus ATCC 10500]